jgi:hypothetical protein
MKFLLTLVALLCSVASISAFSPGLSTVKLSSTSALSAERDEEQELLRQAKSSRSAGADDMVVELMRPLGIVLASDDKGNVYVETVAPKGNAARTGKVNIFIYI